MYRTLFFFSAALTLAACQEQEEVEITAQNGEVVSTVSANDQSQEAMEEELKEIRQEEAERLAEEQANSTTLKFDKLRHDFGNVKPDSDNTTLFEVTNTGKRPLIISDVSASCGCTTPKKPEGPIAPGKSDVIEVTFHPKPGQVNEIIKTVTVTANTMEKVHSLEIRAFVKEK
jgi:PHD/YefM family antitoxin component YafN of YafNO toxin-antitoxin module